MRQKPPRVGTANLDLILRDGDGKPVTAATVRVEGNMSHAGMEPTFAEAVEAEPGRYRAALKLTMPGDWFLTVTARRADGTELSAEMPLPGVRSP